VLAETTGLGQTVVAIAALKIGAVDMAVGNLLGSNLFNIGILALDDLFYPPAPLLAHIAADQIVTAIAAIVMTTIAIIGLTYRIKQKLLLVAWDSLGILIAYIGASLVLYMMR
jgi:cation:H+ antiporter